MKLTIAAAVIAAANLVCFFLMRHDKRCAAAGKRRIPERTLFLSAALFGALGGVAAMQLYRHKTRHLQFRIFFPLLLMLLAAAFGFAVYSGWLA